MTTEHPDGTGGWTGTVVEYDILGRVKRQTVPTEIDANWNPAGDDLSRGWLWNSQEYDWKGRVKRNVPSDSTGSDGKDTLITYEGCGCAGGQVTTVQGPSVPRDDQPTVNARRVQKSYADILGREYKSEVMNWDGSTVYTSNIQTFNGRDQVVNSRQYAGAVGSTTYQDTTATFDGHGRLKTSHKPEQSSGTSTSYNYNLDDSISNVTDARGAAANYTYNNRRLVDQISYAVPGGSGIQVPANVNFTYDNIGNRTAMTDGLGSVAYNYNELSQMTDETRTLTDTIPNAPIASHGFKLEYTYGLSGQLKSLKDPYGQQTNYAYDKAGRLNTVTDAASFAGISTYASNPGYRAWGGLKTLTFGNGAQQTTTFNNRLQPTTFELHKSDNTPIMQKAYEYNKDASLKSMTDSMNHRFDRANKYDFAGRMSEGLTGADARGETIPPFNRYYESSLKNPW